jgi:GR25 family glycosyltransferase involved in LPS biosynthesis
MSDFESIDGGIETADSVGLASALGSIDAVYCISLREQSDRTKAIIDHFRAIGLAPFVTMYRPERGVNPPMAIWTSHRNVARRALANNHKRVLILEDDVRFTLPFERLRARLASAISNLPQEWWALYLCHLPMQAYPVARDAMRVRSGGAFAYIANAPLLEWLARSEPLDPEIPICDIIGPAIDGAFANLPHMYALRPMAARHVDLGTRRTDCQRRLRPGVGAFFDPLFYRDFLLYRFILVSEACALALSPFHALTLEIFRRRSGAALSREARRLRESGGFDAQAYLLANPDVVASGVEPLRHYLTAGAREGRNPKPPLAGFDSELYLAANPDLRAAGIDPLLHYLSYGRVEGRPLTPAPHCGERMS